MLGEAAAECERRDRQRTRNTDALKRRHERFLAQEVKLTESFTAGDTSLNAYKSMSSRLRIQIATAEDLLRKNQYPSAGLMPRVERLLEAVGSMAELHQSLGVARQQQLLALLFQRLAIKGGAIVDFAFKPPFDLLLTDPPDAPGTPPRGISGQFEQPSPKRAK